LLKADSIVAIEGVLKVKNLVKFLVLCAVFGLAFGCSKDGEGRGNADSSSASALEKYERLTMEESVNVDSRSFASPTQVDPDLKVEGIDEELDWLYAEFPDLGSSLCKKGGVWKSSLFEYPTTFRSFGPESNVGTRDLMSPNPSLVTISAETREFCSFAASHWAFSNDGKSVYFKLREDMKWSDGQPCTADDYVFYREAMTNENAEDFFMSDYWDKKKVEKINKYCIKVTDMEDKINPKSTLLLQLNMTPMPKHFFPNGIQKDWYKEYNYKYMPTIGPYVMAEDENITGELIVFKKVPDWWGHKVLGNGMANFDKIEYKVITGGLDIMKELFYKGELYNYALNIPQEWKDSADNSNVTNGYIDRWVFNMVPMQGFSGIQFNVQADFVSDVRVRRALYYAIDMQGMIDNALYGEYKRYRNIGMGHIWGGYDFDDHTITKPDFDPKKAGEMLAEAGYDTIGSDGIRVNKNGQRASFELLYSQPHHTERLTVLREQAKKAGVDLQLKMMQQGMFNAVLNRKHQAWFGGMTTYYYPTYWQSFSSTNAKQIPSNNFYGYSSPEMDRLIEIERKSADLAELSENCKAIQRLVDKEALIIPDYYLDFARAGMWKWVRFPSHGNLKFSDSTDILDPMWGYFWIDEDIKKEVESAMASGKTFEPKVWRLSKRYAQD
jgi:ABC-type dipeptide transport system, periplasmic component